MKNYPFYIHSLLPFMLTLVSCAPGRPSVAPFSDQRQFQTSAYIESMRDFKIETIKGSRLDSLMIIIFKEDFPANEWAEIFKETRTFAEDRKLILREDVSDEKKEKAVERNFKFLDQMSGKAAFMHQWSYLSEQCSVDQDLWLRCENIPSEQNWSILGALEWLVPPVGYEVRLPFLGLRLKKEPVKESTNENDQSKFSLNIRMRLGDQSASKVQFVGDVIPEPGSRFINPKGELTDRFFKIGYAEAVFVAP